VRVSKARACVVAAAALVAALMTMTSPAVADKGGCTQTGSTLSCPIKAGADGLTVGQATFVRTTNSDGTTRVAVHGDVAGGISESHLCFQDTGPYTSKVSPGACALNQGNTGAAVDYAVTFPAGDAAKALYFQFHIVTQGDTAFAGWQNDNSPFYGNAALAPVTATPLPLGALGGAVLSAALGVGLAIALGRRRAAAPSGAAR